MNRAEQAQLALNTNQMSWTELLNEADDIADAYEQDFENEQTNFKYSDGSIGVFLGKTQEIIVYAIRS